MGGPAKVDGAFQSYTDNFYPSEIQQDGHVYSSAQNYFQCAKATDPKDFAKINKAGPGISCWEVGTNIKSLRKDWQKIKVRTMFKANLLKFEQNKEIGTKICKTTGSFKFAMSSFWNEWNQRILEAVRATLQKDQKKMAQFEHLLQQYQKDN